MCDINFVFDYLNVHLTRARCFFYNIFSNYIFCISRNSIFIGTFAYVFSLKVKKIFLDCGRQERTKAGWVVTVRVQGVMVPALVVTMRAQGIMVPALVVTVRAQGGRVPAHCGRVRARGGLMPAIGVRVRGLSSYGARLRATARQLPSSNIEVLFLVGQRGDRASFARTLSLGRVVVRGQVVGLRHCITKYLCICLCTFGCF